MRSAIMDRDPDHLFVYGTLRRGLGHPMARWLLAHAAYVGPATVTGQLYDLGPYPGAVLARGGRVVGEVYRLRHGSPVLAALDAYEGCGPDTVGAPLYAAASPTCAWPTGGA